MSMKRIPIFFTFNNDYVVPAAVAFYSLLNRAKSNVQYDMFVMHSDITLENQHLLESIVERFKEHTLKFIDTQNFLTSEWNTGNFDGHNARNQFTLDTILPCFAARFFPQYDKIVCSDVDIVIMDDISELWDIPLDGKYLAAVKNPFMKFLDFELSHLKPEHYEKLKDSYFAGGIWVLNLDLIRRDNLEERTMEILKDETIIKRWPDQDIMNIACDNRVAYIPLNYISYPYMIDLLKSGTFTSHYTNDELWDSVVNPKIIHYANGKPWKLTTRYEDVWWDIFTYLKLPKTKIFDDKGRESPYYRKCRKYKKRQTMLLVLTTLLLALLVATTLRSFL